MHPSELEQNRNYTYKGRPVVYKMKDPECRNYFDSCSDSSTDITVDDIWTNHHHSRAKRIIPALGKKKVLISRFDDKLYFECPHPRNVPFV